MMATDLQRVGLRTSFAGARLFSSAKVARTAPIFATPRATFFSKTKTADKAAKKVASAPVRAFCIIVWHLPDSEVVSTRECYASRSYVLTFIHFIR